MKLLLSISYLISLLFFVGCNSSAQEQKNLVERIEKIKKDAYAQHPGNVEEGRKAANLAVEREMMTISSSQTKFAVSAGLVGYYYKNVFEFKKICASKGVVLESYPRKFAELHASAMQEASKIVDTKQLMFKLEAQGNKFAMDELEKLAVSQGTNLNGACLFLENNGENLAVGAQYSKILPGAYTILMGKD